MKKITSVKDIRSGDKILLDTEEEGLVIKKTEEGEVYAQVFLHDTSLRKVDPSSIISLQRGGEFFMVEI